jgi:hypothetical protein
MTGYYDIVLGLIPVSLITISAAFVVAGFTLTFAVAAASTVGVALVGHAMFVNGPVDADASTRTDTSTANASRDTPVSAD